MRRRPQPAAVPLPCRNLDGLIQWLPSRMVEQLTVEVQRLHDLQQTHASCVGVPALHHEDRAVGHFGEEHLEMTPGRFPGRATSDQLADARFDDSPQFPEALS